MSPWLREIGQSWRASLRRPGFLLLAVAVLGLGVGALGAVFTLVDGVLFKPLPYAEPRRLVALGFIEQGDVQATSPQQYQQLAGLPGIASMGIYIGKPGVNLAGGGEPVSVVALQMDRGLLPTLGVRPAYGRNFTAQEDQPHGPPAVMLYHGFWQRRFGGDPAVLGQTLQVEGTAHTIVGILPAGFDLDRAAIALPTAFAADSQDDGSNYRTVARLTPSASVAGVARAVDTRLHAFYREQGAKPTDFWWRVHYGAQDFSVAEHADSRATSWLWLACAALLLVIALVNLTNLMLLRMLARSHDASIRAALGAAAWRAALPLLAEALLIAAGGVLLGQLLASVGLLAIRSMMPSDWMVDAWLRPGALQLHAGAWWLAAGIGLSGALLASVLGLWRGRAVLSMEHLREGGRSGLNRRGSLIGRVLVVAQVALAGLLLCTAGVFLHTLLENAHKDLGFDARGVLTFELAPVKARYPDAVAVRRLSQRLIERLQRIPGVQRAAVANNLPAGGGLSSQWNTSMHLPGGENFNAQYRMVGGDYFGVFGMPLLKGRPFVSSDGHGSEPVAVVNQAFARRYFAGQAIGQLIQQTDTAGSVSYRIVGVVQDTLQFGPEDPDSVRPTLFVPLAQAPEQQLSVFRSYEPLRFALKVKGDPEGYRDAVRQAVAEVDPQQPIDRILSMAYLVHDITTDTEFNLMLIGLFGGLALLLAGVGMYAVMAMAVAARERELGVRAALGAAPATLLGSVLRAGMLQVGLGLALGVLLGLLGSGVLRAVVARLGRSVFDPYAMLAAVLVLALAGLLACLLPALRAGRVDPMHALRGD